MSGPKRRAAEAGGADDDNGGERAAAIAGLGVSTSPTFAAEEERLREAAEAGRNGDPNAAAALAAAATGLEGRGEVVERERQAKGEACARVGASFGREVAGWGAEGAAAFGVGTAGDREHANGPALLPALPRPKVWASRTTRRRIRAMPGWSSDGPIRG